MFFAVLSLVNESGAQTTYTWNGGVSDEWGNPSNWTPNGIPDFGDDAIVVSAPNNPVMDEISGLENFTISSGSLDLNGFTLVIYDVANFNGGSISNGNINIHSTAGDATFAGTTFHVGLSINSDNVLFNGSTFNSAVSVTKAGATNNVSTGGNTFNSTLSISVNGTGNITLSNVTPDIFNQNVTFTCTSSGLILPAHKGAANQFNGNIILNCTGSGGGMRFGQDGGTATLASGNSIQIGGSGFSVGELRIRGLTQAGSTAQNLTLTGTASLFLESGNVFNGVVTYSTPNIHLNGTEFFETCNLTKTGSGNNQSQGGNTFHAASNINLTGSGDMLIGFGVADVFTGIATFSNSGSGTIQISIEAAGTSFAQNIVINSTGSSKGVRFGQNGGSASLASGRTIQIGGSGFTAGSLRLRNFTQTGTTAQTLSVTSGTAQLYLESGTTFNGNVTFQFPQLFLNGSTFNGTASLTKGGSTENNGTGGNTFNGATTIVNAGSGRLNLGITNPDIFNQTATFTASGSSMIQLAHTASGTQFNESIFVNSIGSAAGIMFGQNGGTSSLATGKTIQIGASGFETGALRLRNFTQVGSTAQEILDFTADAELYFETGSTFNGSANFTSPNVYLNGSTFNGTAIFTKNAGSSNISEGGNTFNGQTTIINSADADMILGQTNPDIFNANLVIENSGTDVIHLCYGSAGNQFNGNLEFNSIGTAQGILIGQNGGTSTLASTRVMTIGSSGFSSGNLRIAGLTQSGSTAQSLTAFGSGVEVYMGPSNTFNGSFTLTSPGVFLNGNTFNSTVNITKSGSGQNVSSGGNVFNSASTISATGSGEFVLAGSSGDDFNAAVTFQATNSQTLLPAHTANSTFAGNITTVGSSTAIRFASNGGRVTLDGTSDQAIAGDVGTEPEMFNLTLNKATGVTNLNTSLRIFSNMTFTSGRMRINGDNELTFLDNATVSSASNTSHAIGRVRKIGNDAFTFPIGRGGTYRPIGISSPASASTEFLANFWLSDSYSLYDHTSKDVSIDHLSRCEYWTLDRSGSTSAVSVILSWNTTSCGVTALGDLLVARWDGSQWRDHGNGGTTGDVNAGTIVSSSAISNFSPFTLSSSTTENPLPVDLVHFTASAKDDNVLLEWSTLSEVNSNYFVVESSHDAVNFEEITRLMAAGNSNQAIHYRTFDYSPAPGITYYRLRQVDFDGKEMFSNMEAVNFATLWDSDIVVSPNPVIDMLTIRIDPDRFQTVDLELRDMQGRLVKRLSNQPVNPQNPILISMQGQPQGLYFLQAFENGVTAIRRVIKK
jgi:hypothetical protein